MKPCFYAEEIRSPGTLLDVRADNAISPALDRFMYGQHVQQRGALMDLPEALRPLIEQICLLHLQVLPAQRLDGHGADAIVLFDVAYVDQRVSLHDSSTT
jgi:hypothetical protein